MVHWPARAMGVRDPDFGILSRQIGHSGWSMAPASNENGFNMRKPTWKWPTNNPSAYFCYLKCWPRQLQKQKLTNLYLSVLRIDGLKHLLSLSLGFQDDPIYVWPSIPNSTDIDLRWMQLHKGVNLRTDATCEAIHFGSDFMAWHGFRGQRCDVSSPKKHDLNMAKQQHVFVIGPYMKAFGWHESSPSKVQGIPLRRTVGFSADPSTWPYIIWI